MPRLAPLALLAAFAAPTHAHEHFAPVAHHEVTTIDHRFERMDYNARQRRLHGEIAYTEAAIASLRRIQGEYSRINRFGTGNALSLSAEQVRLELLREELLLRDLRDQVLVEQRMRRFDRRAHAMASAAMTQRRTVHAALPAEAGQPTITIVNH